MQAKINYVSIIEANLLLNKLGLKIGSWNQIATFADNMDLNWLNYRAPENSHELMNFAFHVAGWLPEGEWKLLQIDNSSYFDVGQKALFDRILFGSELPKSLVESSSFVFQFGLSKEKNATSELIIANLIFLLLQFECHAQIVSSSSKSEKILSIQDGFVYFMANNNNLSAAESILKVFESSTLSSPDWVNSITELLESKPM